MKNIIVLLVCIMLYNTSKSQNYYFNSSGMSQEVLDNYLDKSITMSQLGNIEGTVLTQTELNSSYQMINDVGAKFIGRVAGWWENGWGQTKLNQIFSRCSMNVTNIKALDNNIICQAAIFEYTSPTLTTFDVPSYVLQAFNQPVVSRKFNYNATLYSSPASTYKIYGRLMTESEKATIPDISKIETQMWFYYLATQYIMSGCESLHFGQVGIMNREDVGNVIYYGLLTKIRNFAKSYNRGIVLCDAHAFESYYQPSLGLNKTQWQDYKQITDINQILMFDFHAGGIAFNEAPGCTPAFQPVFIDKTTPGLGFYGKSPGGKHPQGWTTYSNSYLAEFDNSDIGAVQGCAFNNAAEPYRVWGWDDISYFANQSEIKRNELLKYCYFKIKCMDQRGHLEMPGQREYYPYGGTGRSYYKANTGNFNQQATIKAIWNGTFKGVNSWIHHNFTSEELPEVNDSRAQSSLITYSTDRMYFIGNDGLVHGYIKNNGFKGWNTVSPSWSANSNGSPILSQVKAKSDLIISPDGSLILYIGTDNYIHGFQANSVWSYSYFDFMKPSMQTQNLTAKSNIVFASNNRIYYVAHENSSNTDRVHGFIKTVNSWATVSPTYASQVSQTQMQPVNGALTYDNSKNRLYYVGTNGFLFYYNILSDLSYSYFAVPSSSLVSQGIWILPYKLAVRGNKIFYIGLETASFNSRIHALVDNNGTWNTISPSWSANSNGTPISNQVQSNAFDIAASPDGKSIAYIGQDNKVYVFMDKGNGLDYTYNKVYESDVNRVQNSLSFYNNNQLFYISSGTTPSDMKIHTAINSESFCQNSSIYALEPLFTYNKKDNDDDVLNESISLENTGTNPSTTKTESEIITYLDKSSNTYFIKGIQIPNETLNIKLFNLLGQEFKPEVEYQFNQISMSIEKIPNGIYFVALFDKDNKIISSSRFLK